jgi:histidinol phosphatase-like PHP family hydrolase
MVEIQHRHHLATCRDPLLDVLVHPYWFSQSEFNRPGWTWFNTMKLVPTQYVRELGQTARQTGTAIEINGAAVLKNSTYGPEFQEEYFDFLSILAEEGATFSVGSDAHDIGHLATIQDCWNMVNRLRLTPDRIWKPKEKPLIGHSLPG